MEGRAARGPFQSALSFKTSEETGRAAIFRLFRDVLDGAVVHRQLSVSDPFGIDRTSIRFYLRDINDNPQEYVSNPLKLDFDWLKHRLRDAA